MSDLMREEFEQAVVNMHVSHGVPPEDAVAFLETGSNGYRSVSTKSAWWAWKASRECLVIELPRPAGLDRMSSEISMQEIREDNRFNRALELAKKALTAAGVKYK